MKNEILVAPSDVWAYFQTHKSELDVQMHMIASGDHGKWDIYISEKDGNPSFIVEYCDEVVDEGVAVSKHDCEKTAKELYAEYLDYDELDILWDDDDEHESIEEREDEITVLFRNFLFDLLATSTDEDIIDAIVDDVKEHTLEYIARKYDIPIYRPMYLEDEDGICFYSEYPYEEMIFDDCNPIYESAD